MFLSLALEGDFFPRRPNPLVYLSSFLGPATGLESCWGSSGFLPTQHNDAVGNVGQSSHLRKEELDTFPSRRKSHGAVSKIRLAIHQQIPSAPPWTWTPSPTLVTTSVYHPRLDHHPLGSAHLNSQPASTHRAARETL